MEYRVVVTEQARQLLLAVKDRREQQLLLERLEKLKVEPNQQGKPLSEELAGYRSVRAASQRYRIIYRIDPGQVTVVAVGRRKEGDKQDVYSVTLKLMKRIAQEAEAEKEDE